MLVEHPDHRDAVHQPDDDAARILSVLADPMSLKLILHLLHAGECDEDVARPLQMPHGATAVRLDRLVAEGLIVPSHAAAWTQRYRLADAAAVRLLLDAVRQLAGRQ